MFDEFDSHVIDWLAQLPRSHERNRDERDMGDWFVALCERDDDKAEIKRLEAALTEKALIHPELLALPVVAVSTSGGVETEKAWPLPLTTGDIAFCFADLRWDEQKWKKPLGDKPKWLAACIAIPGVRGVSETRWNPVLIGAALERQGHAKQNNIRAKFQTQPQLAPWLDAWKTYEADNFST